MNGNDIFTATQSLLLLIVYFEAAYCLRDVDWEVSASRVEASDDDSS